MSEGISLPALLTLMFALGAIGLLMSLGRRTQQEQAIIYSLQHTLSGHSGVVNDVAWSPDGRVLASCSDNRTVVCGARTPGRCYISSPVMAAGSMAWRGCPMGVCWPPAHMTHRASVGPARRVAEHTLSGHGGRVNYVAWLPDGRVLASCSHDRTVRLGTRTLDTQCTFLRDIAGLSEQCLFSLMVNSLFRFVR